MAMACMLAVSMADINEHKDAYHLFTVRLVLVDW
jgi:hypothetical protein